MADTTITKFDHANKVYRNLKAHDNGDATYSEQVYLGGGSVTADTELPAAAALDDNMDNPTTPLIGSCLMAFDGSKWDRLAKGANGGVPVEGVAGGTAVPVSGTFWQTTQPVSVNHGTPGTTDYVESRANVRRGTHALHRNAITAADKLINAVAADVTIADNGAGTGSLAASTTYYVTAIAGNSWGPCMVVAGAIKSLASGAYGGATGSYRLTLAQCASAEHYDIFLSVDAAPKWVARVTEAQRAAGDFEITAVGTVAAGGGNPAGTVDINVVGTGNQTSNPTWAQNNAYTPAAAGIVAVDTTGYTYLRVQVLVSVTDLRSGIGASIVPFWSNPTDATRWHQGQRLAVSLLTAVGQCKQQEFVLETNGSPSCKILVGEPTGQNCATSIWVQPY